MLSNQQLTLVLKRAGYSATKPRMKVFSELSGRQPQTIGQIISATSSQIDRASVYRTIELFEELGIVHRIQQGWKYKLELSDQITAHHHHLSCRNCGKVVDLPHNAQTEEYMNAIAQNNGFENTQHQLEISGICPSCQTLISRK